MRQCLPLVNRVKSALMGAGGQRYIDALQASRRLKVSNNLRAARDLHVRRRRDHIAISRSRSCSQIGNTHQLKKQTGQASFRTGFTEFVRPLSALPRTLRIRWLIASALRGQVVKWGNRPISGVCVSPHLCAIDVQHVHVAYATPARDRQCKGRCVRCLITVLATSRAVQSFFVACASPPAHGLRFASCTRTPSNLPQGRRASEKRDGARARCVYTSKLALGRRMCQHHVIADIQLCMSDASKSRSSPASAD